MFFLFAFGPQFCLSILVIALTMFVVPFWFGERRPRRFLVNGLIIFVIALLVLSALRTDFVLNLPPLSTESLPGVGQNENILLRNGTVTPFHADGPTDFAFRVQLFTIGNNTTADFEVRLNVTILDGLSGSFLNTSMVIDPSSSVQTLYGPWYNGSATLYGSVYGFTFLAHDTRNGGNWTRTVLRPGPIAASAGAWYAYNALISSFTIAITLAFYLTIIFMWWYSARMKRTRAELLDRAKAPRRDAETKTSKDGKAAKATAFTCTSCGADVVDDAPSCPKCGAVFED